MIHFESTYFGISSSIALAVAGEISLGFKMTQFPAAIAGSTGARVRWRGKFQAPMTRTVPNGSGCTKTVSKRVRGLFSQNLNHILVLQM